MRKNRGEPAVQRIPCWFCENRFTSRHVLRDGIIRSRSERAGGPYRLYICPACGRENVCEKSLRGRWFASPNYKFTFLDYLFSQVLDPGSAETLLAALTWFRENEERRRYFFERDGDHRHGGRSILGRLWPLPPPPDPAPSRRRHPHPRAEPPAEDDEGEEAETPDEASRRQAPRVRGIVTPYEVLGVDRTASEREIREAFHRLAIHYHPDKVHHLGEEFERMAKEKFQVLKEAYELLLALRARQG